MINLKEKYPDLAKEWIIDKNNIKMTNILNSHKIKAWWKCSKCGYEWCSLVYSRILGCGCPVCGHRVVAEGINDLKTLYPSLIKEWDFEKNSKNGLFPEKVSRRSDKKAWWTCPVCNNSYQTAVKYRTIGTACPKCANETRTSYKEQTIYYYLKKEFEDTINRWNTTGAEVDIFIPSLNLGIEYDGVFFHNSKNSNDREKRKYEHLKELGIKLIRIREKGLDKDSYADYSFYLTKKANDSELEKIIKEIYEIINTNYHFNINPDINIERDRSLIYDQYITQRKENSIEELSPEVLKEWDYKKNKINPRSIIPGSERKVWWLCDKGHSYQQQVSLHVKGAGCPYCAGQLAIKGENDLETTNPELMKEWDYNKNRIKPSEVKAGSDLKVWWLCSKGHSYKSSIGHKVRDKRGCPYCAGKLSIVGENDLVTLRPELIKEWDYNKNKKRPEEYTCGSMLKVWWICPKGHSYDAVIRSRANLNTTCPVCNGKRVLKGYNDFASQQTELIKEWNYEKNNAEGIYPEAIHMQSYKKVWWKCSVCGYEWKATPAHRSKGHGCLICGNVRSGLKRRKRKKDT